MKREDKITRKVENTANQDKDSETRASQRMLLAILTCNGKICSTNIGGPKFPRASRVVKVLSYSLKFVFIACPIAPRDSCIAKI